MTARALLEALRSRGVELRLGDDCRTVLFRGASDEDREIIRREKPSLRILLALEGASPTITPISILASSRFGSLTRHGLRDALWLRTELSREDADLVVGAYLESGLLVEAEDGLLMVRQ